MNIAVFVVSGAPDTDPGEELVDGLRRQFPEHRFVVARDAAQLEAALSEAEVLFASLLSAQMLAAAPRLRWFHAASIQFGDHVEAAVFDAPIEMTNSRGAFAQVVAENILGALLFLSHRMETSSAALGRGHAPYVLSRQPSRRLHGLTAGIVGLGHNGAALASRCAAMGMRVVATRRTPAGSPPAGVAEWWGPSGLADLLGQADALCVTAPLTDETRGLLDRQALSRLPRGAILVNAGRPALVDDQAVLEALASGQLQGFGCDDGLPADSPLRQSARDDVVIFPHAGPGDRDNWPALFALFARNLGRYLRGEPLLNPIQRALRY